MQEYPGSRLCTGYGEPVTWGTALQAVGPYRSEPQVVGSPQAVGPYRSEFTNPQPSNAAAYVFSPVWVVVGVSNPPAASSTLEQRQNAGFPLQPHAQSMAADNRPIATTAGDIPLGWPAQTAGDSPMSWPAREPQASTILQDSEVRPVGLVQSVDDCPINARSHTNHVVWGNLETSSGDFASGGSHSSESLSISSSDGAPDRPRGLKKLINRRIDPNGIIWRSSPSGSGGSDRGETNSQNSQLRQPWHDVDVSDMNPTAASATGTSFGEYEYAPNPRENNSGGESDEECNAKPAELQEVVQQADDASLEELLRLVPYNEKGLLMSIGSIGHSENACKPPCVSVLRRKGCAKEVMCGFCHFPHAGKKPASRPRPDKGMRGRYRKHWEKFKSQIEENPDTFDVAAVKFPPSIESDEILKKKLMTRMRNHQEDVLANGVAEAASSSTVVAI